MACPFLIREYDLFISEKVLLANGAYHPGPSPHPKQRYCFSGLLAVCQQDLMVTAFSTEKLRQLTSFSLLRSRWLTDHPFTSSSFLRLLGALVYNFFTRIQARFYKTQSKSQRELNRPNTYFLAPHGPLNNIESHSQAPPGATPKEKQEKPLNTARCS